MLIWKRNSLTQALNNQAPTHTSAGEVQSTIQMRPLPGQFSGLIRNKLDDWRERELRSFPGKGNSFTLSARRRQAEAKIFPKPGEVCVCRELLDVCSTKICVGFGLMSTRSQGRRGKLVAVASWNNLSRSRPFSRAMPAWSRKICKRSDDGMSPCPTPLSP